jgi:hypothetical protein
MQRLWHITRTSSTLHDWRLPDSLPIVVWVAAVDATTGRM